MNKTDKRQRSIRNKLMAAVAMLLVASIMTVTTTYAWFTLSTAPEVQGITTTVGANGNLEIALSPASGDADDITSAMGDSDKAWTVKNLTWGNLLNLDDASYGLAGINLLPARLNLSNPSTIPLKTPVYGSDGRVMELAANSAIGKLVVSGDQLTYETDADYRGVRAIGTSSSMTEYQITFNNYLASMGQNASAAKELAQSSLRDNGSQLAQMAIAHAGVSGEDTNDYSEYKTNMENVITVMGQANDKLKEAIRDAFIATAASNASGNTADNYTAVMTAVNAEPAATLEDLMVAAGWMTETTTGDVTTYTVTGDNAICTAYKEWAGIEADLDAAAAAYATIDADSNGKVSWTEASTVLQYLMNTTGIKLNNYSLSEFKVQAKRYMTKPLSTDVYPNTIYDAANYDAALVQYNEAVAFMQPFTSGNTKLQLGSGSGVYADMGAMVGNLSADVNVDVAYDQTTMPNVPINITTTTASSDGGYMGTARTALATTGAFQPAGESTTTGVLNETYGYIVDFFFRTNASGSQLLLQTDPAQRVYEEGNSDATLGNGSTMTFRSGTISGSAVQGLMDCIRVVFLDTAAGSILGIAKLDMANPTQTIVTEATETAPAVVDITAKLYLCDYAENATTGVLELTNPKTNPDDAVLCDLPANTAKAVSVMVYLDGDNVTNEDVANAATSTTGTLNLQFASSAQLVPMENEALKNMAAEDEEEEEVTYNVDTTTNVSNATVTGAFSNGAYGFTVTPADGYTVTSVSYKMGDATTETPLTAVEGAYAIPNVSGDLVIYVVTAEETP